MWREILLGLGVGLVLAYAGLLATLLVLRPRGAGLRELVRLLPDLLRLLRRLAADRSLPRGVRVRLLLLLGYLAIPVDLVPDFIPVLGYADDAIVVALALRSVVRHAGSPAIRRHWPGTPQGLEIVLALAGRPARGGRRRKITRL